MGRVHQHKTRSVPGFTAQYGVDRLVWFESYDDPTDAKKWRAVGKSG